MKHINVLFVLLIIFVGCSAPEPIEFPDPHLAAAIREELGLAPDEPITQKKLEKLESFQVWDNGISDLTGIENMTNLTSLSLGSDQIADITPLVGLTNLTTLILNSNQIIDTKIQKPQRNSHT